MFCVERALDTFLWQTARNSTSGSIGQTDCTLARFPQSQLGLKRKTEIPNLHAAPQSHLLPPPEVKHPASAERAPF